MAHGIIVTPEMIDAVVGWIAVTFDGNVPLFVAWLQRSKLETEAAALQSQMRVVAANRDEGVTAAETELQAIQAALTAKLAEIDAL